MKEQPQQGPLDLDVLLRQCANRDQAAFERVYQLTSAKLFGIALRILKDRSAAEDVVQDAYVRIWRKAASFDPAAGRAVSWLSAIARNAALDRLRYDGPTQRRQQTSDDDRDLLDEAPDPATFDPTTKEALFVCLARLDKEVRNCVVLAYCGGYSREELATRFQRPVGTIKTWLRRSLLALNRCLDDT